MPIIALQTSNTPGKRSKFAPEYPRGGLVWAYQQLIWNWSSHKAPKRYHEIGSIRLRHFTSDYELAVKVDKNRNWKWAIIKIQEHHPNQNSKALTTESERLVVPRAIESQKLLGESQARSKRQREIRFSHLVITDHANNAMHKPPLPAKLANFLECQMVGFVSLAKEWVGEGSCET